MKPSDAIAIVQAAWERRQPHLDRRRLDAWRLLNGIGDGAPAGLTVDRYDRWWVVSARPTVSSADIDAFFLAVQTVLPGEGAVMKTLRKPVDQSESKVLMGQVPEAPISIREEDAVFLCDLNQGVQTGLFLDHRETRLWARRYASGAEVLNLFAYTGAFSVHMALGGAKRVTSVDTARRVLARGRDNMSASGLDPNLHRWFPDDVLKHLRRGSGQGDYDVVILDPPVFGRARGRRFSIGRHLMDLLEGSMRKLKPTGTLIFSTHARELSEDALLELVHEAAQSLGRKAKIEKLMGLPHWDHPVAREATVEDRGDYLKTLVLRVEGT